MGGPGASPQRALLDQRVHGRALALDPNRPGPPPWIHESALGTWLATLGRGAAPPHPADLDPGALLARGYAILLVQGPSQIAVARALGPPRVAHPDVAAWDLARLHPSAWDTLPPEPAP
jgi:hypothetical protein